MAGPLDKKFDVIEGGTDAFLASLSQADNELALEMLKIYTRFMEGRVLTLKADELAKLDGLIVSAIASTSYGSAVNTYIPNFDALNALNTEIHKLENGINVQDVLLEADKIKNHQEVITAQLKGTREARIQVTEIGDRVKIKRVVNIENKSLEALVNPIAEVIRQDVILGVSFESATEAMLDAIKGGDLGLEQWAGQIARDALSQQDGIIQQEIKEEFDLKFFRYQGTVKTTTRPFCYHMLQKENPVYTEKELQKILDEHIPGGVPSESTTTNTANGKQQKKGAGMIPGTTLENVTIRRGGNRCRHAGIWSAVK